MVQSSQNITAKKAEYKKGDFVFSLANLRKITLPRSVTSSGSGGIIPSHLYVKFKPVTQEHIKAIEAQNIPTYPYPLATDSLDPSNPDYSTLYTFLPINKLIPNCPYEILDTVMLLNPESAGAAQAMTVAGKADRIPINTNPRNLQNTTYVLEPLPCDPWYDGPVAYNNTSSSINMLPPPEDCDNPPPPPPPPPPPVPLLPADPRPVPNTVAFNSCSMNTDVNYPSGRITVEETQWGNGSTAYEGVADIKIEILGPGGQRVVTQTNRFGCFKATNAIRGFRSLIGPRLPVIMNVIFDSERKEIRGYNDAVNLAQYSLPLRHIYGNIAYRMNDASVSYERNTNDQDNDCKYYVAATVNNALYEFDEYAAQDGILPPPTNLKILVHRFARAGAAPMFNKISNSHPFETIAMKGFFIAIMGIGGGIITGDPALGAIIGTNMAHYAPDVSIGYGWNNFESFATDQIKEIAYHEFAHASHYQNAGFELWRDNINFTILHNGYGNAGDNGVGRTDLIEMWGYFIGREYAHRRYGPTRHSLTPMFLTTYDPPVTIPEFRNSWYALNELVAFEYGHIPTGFLHDVKDNNQYNQVNWLPESATVRNQGDSIHGITIGGMYSLLNSNTTTAGTFINQLAVIAPSYSSENTQSRFDSLKIRYGY